MVLPSLAAPIDYNDYVTKVQVDGDNDLVTVTIPADLAFVCVYDSEGSEFYRGYGSTHDVVLLDHTRYKIEVYPFGYPWNGTTGLDLSYIPVGTRIASGFGITSDPYSATTIPTTSVLYWYDPGYTTVVYELPLEDSVDSPHFFAHAYSVDPPDNTSLLGSGFVLDGLSFLDEQIASIYVQDTQMVFTISSLLRQQQLTGKTNDLLKEVESQLAEQGKTLDDIRDQMQDTNDKLDGIQGSLDELPGEVGDEIQGVIDNEKQEAEGEGNKFVDQILDILPDQSTEILAAIKSLTDAMSYTGTDTVLTIPPVVLPGIDGLFEDTVIWEGGEFSLGEYLTILPSTLLTLAQSLFTIAIVLYCAYELKDVISFVFTLNSLHKGDFE